MNYETIDETNPLIYFFWIILIDSPPLPKQCWGMHIGATSNHRSPMTATATTKDLNAIAIGYNQWIVNIMINYKNWPRASNTTSELLKPSSLATIIGLRPLLAVSKELNLYPLTTEIDLKLIKLLVIAETISIIYSK